MIRPSKVWLTIILLAAPLGLSQAASQATTKNVASARSADPARPPTQAEALAFVKAYSPSDVRRMGELAMIDRDFVAGLRRDPSAAALLDQYPQLATEWSRALKSQIDVYMTEYDDRFFPRATAIVQAALSRADVLELTAFYQSPVGRMLVQSAALKADGSEIIDRVLEGQSITADVAERQVTRSGLASYGELSTEDRAKVLAVMKSPAGRNLAPVARQLMALQAELISVPGPKFSAGVKAAMAAAFERVTGVNPDSGK